MVTATDTQQLAAELGALLLRKKWFVTTAESCTGGGIAYYLTAVAGSSAYLDRTFVTYSNKAKQQLLGVRSATLLQFGAVSDETVKEMAAGAAVAANAQLAIAVSGIAGPGGGSASKPVGTVWFSFWLNGELSSELQHFSGDRGQVRQQAIDYALKRCILLLTALPN
ncbi:nicotinamide-nucleotide amidohydrolase family protein [Arsukibacterium sp.]|uniref:nicotinamide-nucleotide amidohydrolase family protein n=1 Tax=Arsukibacterium sp. TaxID=1977258 RepID=UPI00299CE41E|nr:nicotinamide-nucleotide amidohydrolase family protein [Arsukibacterium sp.]MDX1676438.1 nicotinamide-nucleotide amidohydrolase family protein [Arsukibacterium sp.]